VAYPPWELRVPDIILQEQKGAHSICRHFRNLLAAREQSRSVCCFTHTGSLIKLWKAHVQQITQYSQGTDRVLDSWQAIVLLGSPKAEPSLNSTLVYRGSQGSSLSGATSTPCVSAWAGPILGVSLVLAATFVLYTYLKVNFLTFFSTSLGASSSLKSSPTLQGRSPFPGFFVLADVGQASPLQWLCAGSPAREQQLLGHFGHASTFISSIWERARHVLA
jgi:hypothetical protein